MKGHMPHTEISALIELMRSIRQHLHTVDRHPEIEKAIHYLTRRIADLTEAEQHLVVVSTSQRKEHHNA